MEKKKFFKFAVGEPVYNKWEDEGDVIDQRRIYHGRPYYRLRYDRAIRPESDLLGSDDFNVPKDLTNTLVKIQFL